MDSKEIVSSYADEVWVHRNIEAIYHYVDPHILIHSLLGNFYGRKAMLEVVNSWQTAFPDLTVVNQSIVSEDNLTVLHWDVHGTHKGFFKGIEPTNKTINYSGVSLYRTLNNKIIEYWAYLDMHQLFKHLGANKP